jgi:hypothetical protein
MQKRSGAARQEEAGRHPRASTATPKVETRLFASVGRGNCPVVLRARKNDVPHCDLCSSR